MDKCVNVIRYIVQNMPVRGEVLRWQHEFKAIHKKRKKMTIKMGIKMFLVSLKYKIYINTYKFIYIYIKLDIALKIKQICTYCHLVLHNVLFFQTKRWSQKRYLYLWSTGARVSCRLRAPATSYRRSTWGLNRYAHSGLLRTGCAHRVVARSGLQVDCL